MHERHLDDVFGNEPDLQLVRADHVANEEVVGSLISLFFAKMPSI